MPQQLDSMSNKDLLIRIDERQQAITRQIGLISKKLDTKLDRREFVDFYRDDFKPVKDKADKVDRTLLLMFGAALGGGTVGGLINRVAEIALAIF